MDGGDDGNLIIKKRFVSEAELDEWSLYERLQEQKDKKQQEYEEQFKLKNMVRGLDEDETNFLDGEYRNNLKKVGISQENKKEVEKKLTVKPIETKNKFSQAKLLAGAVKHKSLESSNTVKRLKPDPEPDDENQESSSCKSLGNTSLSGPSIHCPSAAVCISILPGLGAYSESSDSESSSDSKGTINATGTIVSSVFRTNTFLEAP
uniref:FAM192A/Fyv6 N-terminal domain-containing protein n=1 Tax=Rhinopithecus roxellana TaxID=61622 RepID=A0A2K6RLW0_RHIRO